jgi:hypothetical protein
MQGAFDGGMIDRGVGMVRRGNELLMYYGGSRVDHGQLPHSHKKPGNGGIGMARIRLDGFVSQDAPPAGGMLTTVPMRCGGSRLVVNMDGSASGTLKVELLDEAGNPIEGLSGNDAHPLHGNDVNRPVSWKGGRSLSDLSSRPIRLRFTGRSVKLYAFQFVD